jgi:hypothetical protein
MVVRAITFLLGAGAVLGAGLVFHCSPVAIGLGLLFVLAGYLAGEASRIRKGKIESHFVGFTLCVRSCRHARC